MRLRLICLCHRLSDHLFYFNLPCNLKQRIFYHVHEHFQMIPDISRRVHWSEHQFGSFDTVVHPETTSMMVIDESISRLVKIPAHAGKEHQPPHLESVLNRSEQVRFPTDLPPITRSFFTNHMCCGLSKDSKTIIDDKECESSSSLTSCLLL